MSQPDYTVRAGDTEPVFSQQLTYTNGSPVDLTGCTLSLILRDQTASAPVTLTGNVSATATPTDGLITYTPSSADTVTAGNYMGIWQVQFAGGQIQTFPTVGYLWIRVEENLAAGNVQQLVNLPDVKDHLNIPATDRSHDGSLIRLVHAIRPVIERLTGPIIPTIFEEWHDGGQCFVQVRRRPSTSYGTSPVLDLIGVDEYRGPTKYSLAVIADPSSGGIYSVHMDRLGKITRRTTGGGVTAFPAGPETVHVWYRSGQSSTPENVRDGALEMIRENYDVTQALGHGMRTPQDQQLADVGKIGMSSYVRQMLAPNRRRPSIA